jgi:hypothetical protein
VGGFRLALDSHYTAELWGTAGGEGGLGVPLSGVSPKGAIKRGTTVVHCSTQQQQQQRFRGISLEVGDVWSAGVGGERTGRSINLQLGTATAATTGASTNDRYGKPHNINSVSNISPLQKQAQISA